MNSIPIGLPEVILLKQEVFADERGFFYESFNQSSFEKATNLSPTFVQGNEKGILRRLHYQMSPKARGKLARVVQKEQLWIHAGFAHGSRTLSTADEFRYVTTQYYRPAHETLHCPE